MAFLPPPSAIPRKEKESITGLCNPFLPTFLGYRSLICKVNILITISDDLKGPKSHESMINEVISYRCIDQAEATFITYSKRDALPGGLLNST